VWNREKRIQGCQDSPLTTEGEALSRIWGQRLKAHKWDRILVSDTGRAKKTSDLINSLLQIQVIRDPRLREQDWGEWTGKTIKQLKRDNGRLLAKQEAAGWRFCPPGGEDRNTVWERSYSALREAAEKWPGENILVITHQEVIKCLVYRLYRRKFLPEEPSILYPYYLHWLIYYRDGFRVKKINALALSGSL
jgi:probable phosphoglycerate mutase